MNSLRTRVSVLDRQRRHRSTARAIWRLLPEPESWLDVGTGDAHFPETARQLFPYTSIDGLDPTPRVAYARHAERVEEAYAGHVTDPHITTILRARYDIVTLLERRSPAPDPAAELNAALTLLRPGGLLLVEAAPPEAHGLRAQLESQGCTIVATSRHVLDRLPYTCRIIARRTASAA
ncbi:methyltransferase domain-containing protein [Streptomyces sp. NBC_01530]|uniref:methyltransferase domain-containing protein n=1 Tax=Streptomyces sp. NBC_01530 TaxID=2903895 RepID=UPI0038678DC6